MEIRGAHAGDGGPYAAVLPHLMQETELQKMLADEKMRSEQHKTHYQLLKAEHTRSVAVSHQTVSSQKDVTISITTTFTLNCSDNVYCNTQCYTSKLLVVALLSTNLRVSNT